MAVIQISRIQVRRGLHDNLPQLASAELGWSIDQRRLFIGNGTTTEGAPTVGKTELLTEHSDILALINIFSFKGEPSGSVASTGPSNTVFTRSLQEKLDDFVNVRDFGAKGDGQTDDTLAIRRALNNTYSYSSTISGVTTRRTVYFPAGKYVVNDSIAVPPFIKIIGDGKNSTLFFANGTAFGGSLDYVFTLADNNGNTGSNFGSAVGLIATQGKDYFFEDIGIHNGAITVNPCFNIAGGDNITFSRVKFEGPSASVVDPGTTHSAVYVENHTLTAGYTAKNIKFVDCAFINHGYGIETKNAVSGLVLEGCAFDNLYTTKVLSDATTDYTITNSTSTNIIDTTIDTNFVDSHSGANIASAKTLTLTQGTTGTIAIGSSALTNFSNVEIDFTMTIGTSKRKGTLKGVGTGSAYFWDTDYIETSVLNVSLIADPVTGDLAWDTTNAADDTILTYRVSYHN